jgi:hypothetical protein
VRLHVRAFSVVERAGLAEDLLVEQQFADVVQECSGGDGEPAIDLHAELVGDLDRKGGHGVCVLVVGCTVSVALIPEANARPWLPSSRDAMHCSSAALVGLPVLEYS